jgi:hypothetical protein
MTSFFRRRVTAAIARLKLRLMLADPSLTGEEADRVASRRIAAELAQEQRQRRRAKAQAARHGKDAATAMLLAELAGISERTRATDLQYQAATNAANTLTDKVARAVRTLADAVGVTQPEPEPVRPQQPMIRAEGSSAQLIPDEEFEIRWHDLTTENWKRSIELNARIQREREARRRRGSSGYLIG